MNLIRLLSPFLLLGAVGIAAGGYRSSSVAATPTLRSLYGLHAPVAFNIAHTSLVLIDFQEEFFSGKLPVPGGAEAVDRAAELLEWARIKGILVVHVRNIATRADSPIFAPKSPTTATVSALAPMVGETTMTKSMAGAFSRTDLDSVLRARGVDTLILAGIMTHLAVDSTARDATVLGYKVVIASDATATRDLPGVDHATLQRASLAALADRFADVMPAQAVMGIPVEGK